MIILYYNDDRNECFKCTLDSGICGMYIHECDHVSTTWQHRTDEIDVKGREASRRRSTAAVSKEAISFDPFGNSLSAS